MKKFKLSLITAAVIMAVVLAGKSVSANGSYFVTSVTTASATSSRISISPSASTTLTFDSFVVGSVFAADRASLLIQHTASTSLSSVKITLQYSQDGVDWYGNNLAATTSPGSITDITTDNTYQLTGNTTSSSTNKIISVLTPTRFVRAVISSAVATSSVWAQFVPIRQVTQ